MIKRTFFWKTSCFVFVDQLNVYPASLRQRRLEQRDVRRVQVRAVEREAVGERLAVGREELVEKVEPVQAGLGLHGAAQRGVRVRVR